ncbi:GDP-D-glucose phosphorylase 1 [Trichomycterus rosablanca]|uniref:GDP-D-glucose phosphorylase 1 n=1 Tax=Trichomycterus rosablanca TaxID=2290929 RepID=UPI002F34EFDA
MSPAMECQNHTFTYTNKDFVYEVCRNDDKTSKHEARFDSALKSGWSEKMNRGLFRYQLGQLETRVLTGECGYIAQLNTQRGTERRKPQLILSIRQQFDPKLFNFNKINQEEILFQMCKAADSCVQNGIGSSCFVIINASPLEFGHCLLVPEPLRCHPQILTPLAVRFGVESVFLSADPSYRVGFNSLGAFASVNHLHLHGYYLNHPLKIEWIRVEPILPEKNLYRVADFTTGFMFYTEEPHTIADTVCRLTDILVERNIAHNVYMTRGCHPDSDGKASPTRHGVRVFVWPRKSCFGAKEESAFNVALCELAGHLPFKNRQDFDSLDEDGVKAIVQKYTLGEEEFTELQKLVVGELTST